MNYEISTNSAVLSHTRLSFFLSLPSIDLSSPIFTQHQHQQNTTLEYLSPLSPILVIIFVAKKSALYVHDLPHSSVRADAIKRHDVIQGCLFDRLIPDARLEGPPS